MKAILMSIRPQHVANILNGLKTLEIRKKFPKDYVGWVYIYVTQNHKHAGWKNRDTLKRDSHDEKPTNHFQLWTDDMVEDKDKINGKVVARFWCDKVDKVHLRFEKYCAGELSQDGLLKYACLTEQELDNYLWSNICCGYAIHITKLKIFDKPKEIKEFYKVGCEEYFTKHVFVDHPNFRPIYESELKQFQFTRAPQSYCFIEV